MMEQPWSGASKLIQNYLRKLNVMRRKIVSIYVKPYFFHFTGVLFPRQFFVTGFSLQIFILKDFIPDLTQFVHKIPNVDSL